MDRCKWDSCAAKNISPMWPEKITSPLNVTIYYPEALACKEFSPQVCLCMFQSLPDVLGKMLKSRKDCQHNQGCGIHTGNVIAGVVGKKGHLVAETFDELGPVETRLSGRCLESPFKWRFNTRGMPLIYNARIQMLVASSLRIPLFAVTCITCPEDPAFISLDPTWNMPIEWRALDYLAKCKSATMDHIQCYHFYMCFGSRLFILWKYLRGGQSIQNIDKFCKPFWPGAKPLCFFVIIWNVAFCSRKRLQNYYDGLLYSLGFMNSSNRIKPTFYTFF